MCFEDRKRIENDSFIFLQRSEIFFLEGGKKKYKTSAGYQAVPH